MIARDKSGRTRPFSRLGQLAGRTLVIASISIALAMLAIFLWYSLHVLFLIFAGILAAILLRGLAEGVSKVTGLGPKAALAVVLLLLVAIVVGAGWFTLPTLSQQLSQLGEKLPVAIARAKQYIQSTPLGASLINRLPDASAVSAWGTQMLGSVGTVISGAVGGVVTVVVIAFIGLYMALEPELYVRGLLRLMPRERRDRFAEVLGAIGYTLKWWLIGQGIDMIIVGILTSLGLWLIGVPLALLLGFIAAISNFIPNFGPIISLIPAMLLALTVSPEKVLWVVVFYTGLQTLEGYVLMPMIQRRAVDVPGALVMVAQVLLGVLAGGLGLALATPVAAVAVVAVKMLYVEDVLGERIETPADGDARKEIREVREATEEVNRDARPAP